MQHSLQQLQQRCGISPLPPRSNLKSRSLLRPHQSSKAFLSYHQVVQCSDSDSRKQQPSTAPAQTAASMLLAATLTIGNLFATDSALAKTNNPLKKSDPYEVAFARATFTDADPPVMACATTGISICRTFKKSSTLEVAAAPILYWKISRSQLKKLPRFQQRSSSLPLSQKHLLQLSLCLSPRLCLSLRARLLPQVSLSYVPTSSRLTV